MTLRRARREVARKSDRQIERETAKKWAERAIACYERAATCTGAARVRWLLRASLYQHEALEHGAMVEDFGKTAGKIQRQIMRKR